MLIYYIRRYHSRMCFEYSMAHVLRTTHSITFLSVKTLDLESNEYIPVINMFLGSFIPMDNLQYYDIFSEFSDSSVVYTG